MQYRVSLIAQLTLAALLLPSVVFSACSSHGYTVVFVNGIWNSKEQAQDSTKELSRFLGSSFLGQEMYVKTGYNPSHVAGLGDLTQVAVQGFGTSVSSFDRDTILLQIHPEVTTEKILLVGHSQGTYYTNDIYQYLTSKGGVSAGEVGVFNLATPANYVAGGGTYLTSRFDSVINAYREFAQKTGALPPLPANTELAFGSSLGNGHNFNDNYLKYGGDEVVSKIHQQLAGLEADGKATESGCYTPPSSGLSYESKKIFYAIADPAASGLVATAVVGWKGATFAVEGVKGGLAAIGSLFGGVANNVIPEPHTSNLPGSHTVLGALYGSSVTEQDLKDLLGNGQAGAVALASQNEESEPAAEDGLVKGAEIEIPLSPLIPPPAGGAVTSPGFGGGGGKIATIDEPDSGAPSAPSAPVPAAPVPDGVPPTLTSVMANQYQLQPSYSSIAAAPMATSGSVWVVRMVFDEDLSLAPSVSDKPSGPMAPSTFHTVDDCADGNAQSYCFTYPATPGIDTLEWWNFEISSAADVSGEVMVPATYAFSIDTAAPTVSPVSTGRNSVLPVVDGRVSQDNAFVQVEVNGNFFTTRATANYWFVTLQAGQELSPGYFTVQASSTDAAGNAGPLEQWQILIDLVAPTISLMLDITEGQSISSSTPFVGVSVSDDNAGVSHVCEINGASSVSCTGLDLTIISAGAHIFKVTATDAGGNQTVLTRNFTVLP